MARGPFQQSRFASLPDEPRVPHLFFETETLDLEVRSAALGAMRVHVRRYGQGPPLLLVHGLMTSSYSWRYAFEPLGQRFTCYAPDLPSAGRSGHAARALSPARLGAWLADVQRALGIRGCAVIGNSMGGYLAMHLALDDPEAMSRLVNLHSPGAVIPRLVALDLALRLPGARALLRRMVQRDPERWVHRNVHYWDESLKSRQETREYGAPLATRDGVDGFAGYLGDTMAVAPMRAFEHRLQALRAAGEGFPVPLLLVYAERDPMVPPVVGERLRALVPGARFVQLREASHFAHVDACDRFAAVALAFLDPAT